MQKQSNGALSFIHHEAAGGIFLVIAAVLALLMANSPLSQLYDGFLHTPIAFRFGAFKLDKTLLHWINDGLMAIFFFLVGLEIKRELFVGELSSVKQAALPGIAALGGMVVPALIYLLVNFNVPQATVGWAIPTATDIAFAVGVLALLGPRIPPALKIFVLALAIIDDLGAIVIIALFYTSSLSVYMLALAAIGIAALSYLNHSRSTRIWLYVAAGLFVWVCVLKSGVHATLAGVVTAFAVPLVKKPGATRTIVEELEETLHPWVTFGVLPLFAFANAGVSLAGVTLAKLMSPIPLGIALGLAVGKPIGIFASTWGAVQLGLGARPQGSSWLQIFGVSLLAGIGFTMSLFIGMLAFPDPAYAADIRIGVLAGSLVAAIVGYLVLSGTAPASPPAAPVQPLAQRRKERHRKT